MGGLNYDRSFFFRMPSPTPPHTLRLNGACRYREIAWRRTGDHAWNWNPLLTSNLRRRALSQVFSYFLFVRAHTPPSPSHTTPSCPAWWSPPLLLPAALTLTLSHPPTSIANAPTLPQPSAMAMAPSSLPSPSARFVFLSPRCPYLFFCPSYPRPHTPPPPPLQH